MDNNFLPNEELPASSEAKKRHGCLTAWLAFVVIVNIYTSYTYFLKGQRIREVFQTMPSWTVPALGFLCFVQALSAILLFKWKKFGFWLFCVTNVIALIVNAIGGVGLVLGSIIAGLFSVGCLFGALQIGKPNGWKQLE